MDVKYFNSCILCFIFVTSLAMFGNGKINECNRCKILSNSFNNWLQKTARGKHEGGDAAWEEAKLKSYSRSEMRFVEIQEGLCSDVKRHQDQCYALAEEVEHLLEKWWMHEDPHPQDLFISLCVDTLQYCCPKNHYGPLCAPCPLDENNKICGHQGECDGEGTRKGNGTCICNKGYSGEFCESCTKNYYSSSDGYCKPCHYACNGCFGEGAAACALCKIGWQLESGVCTDINECLSSNICESHQFCFNWEGSYSCKNCDDTCKTCKGEGLANCTSCNMDHTLWDCMCLDGKFKQQLLFSAVKRAVSYLLLFIITIFIYQKIKTLGSLFILLIGIIIYFYEKDTKLNIFAIYYDKLLWDNPK